MLVIRKMIYFISIYSLQNCAAQVECSYIRIIQITAISVGITILQDNLQYLHLGHVPQDVTLKLIVPIVYKRAQFILVGLKKGKIVVIQFARILIQFFAPILSLTMETFVVLSTMSTSVLKDAKFLLSFGALTKE